MDINRIERKPVLLWASGLQRWSHNEVPGVFSAHHLQSSQESCKVGLLISKFRWELNFVQNPGEIMVWLCVCRGGAVRWTLQRRAWEHEVPSVPLSPHLQNNTTTAATDEEDAGAGSAKMIVMPGKVTKTQKPKVFTLVVKQPRKVWLSFGSSVQFAKSQQCSVPER